MDISPSYLRPEPGEYPAYYEGYYSQLPSGDIFKLLAGQPHSLHALVGGLEIDRQLFRYADDKWSVKEVVGHLVDTERIFSNRALRIMRADTTPLPGYDQNAYVDAAEFDGRSMASLLAEFEALRHSNVLFLENHAPEVYARRGIASDTAVSVRAIVVFLAAHVEHHSAILREHYLTSS